MQRKKEKNEMWMTFKPKKKLRSKWNHGTWKWTSSTEKALKNRRQVIISGNEGRYSRRCAIIIAWLLSCAMTECQIISTETIIIFLNALWTESWRWMDGGTWEWRRATMEQFADKFLATTLRRGTVWSGAGMDFHEQTAKYRHCRACVCLSMCVKCACDWQSVRIYFEREKLKCRKFYINLHSLYVT